MASRTVDGVARTGRTVPRSVVLFENPLPAALLRAGSPVATPVECSASTPQTHPQMSWNIEQRLINHCSPRILWNGFLCREHSGAFVIQANDPFVKENVPGFRSEREPDPQNADPKLSGDRAQT